MSALWALDINDRWHYANDEHGGYPESELCDQTQAAIATLRTALAAQPQQATDCTDPHCPCRDGDACHYKDGADGTKAMQPQQAAPP